MHVLICNERFTFRFGVDRVLLILAQGLRARGHQVTLIGCRADDEVVASCSDAYVSLPQFPEPYIDLDSKVAAWLGEQLGRGIGPLGRPDVALIGGWPFFSAIPRFESASISTVFLDYGVTPAEGLPEGHVAVLNRLRQLRRETLPGASIIAAGSAFIADTQSIPDSKGRPSIQVTYAGADHLEHSLWQEGKVTSSAGSGRTQAAQNDDSIPLVMNLGRWEPGCYKNSEAVVDLAAALKRRNVRIRIGVLADPSRAADWAAAGDAVVPLGHPDDAELQRLMATCTAGISVSTWEGFNLPLAEMQWLGRPAFAFDVGAHREVIADHADLCADVDEMADKLAALLADPQAHRLRTASRLEHFRKMFRWERTIEQIERLLAQATVRRRHSDQWPRLVVDVTNAAHDTANSGVIRVTRRLCRELQAFCDPDFVVWDPVEAAYVYPNDDEYALLAGFNGPQPSQDGPRSSSTRRLRLRTESARDEQWLLLTETVLEERGRQIRQFARQQNMRVAAIFYDAIPVLRPDLVKDVVIRENHEAYMRGLSQTDLVLAISEFSSNCLQRFWRRERIEQPPPVFAHWLPGEFGGSGRRVEPGGPRPAARGRILCVSTLEPRKNHRTLLEAFQTVRARHPDIAWHLDLVGNRYAGADDIVSMVEAASKDPAVTWHRVVDDTQLASLYHDCSFTVYPSLLEGFGMPILESLWHGKPCIASATGVMGELARPGGCDTVDVRDPEALADALARLAIDDAHHVQRLHEIQLRPITDWNSYALGALEHLAQAPVDTAQRQPGPRDEAYGSGGRDPASVEELLYPACRTAEWRMRDAERLALTAVVHRLRPQSVIQIGYRDPGTLSLLRQYCPAVFSIAVGAACRAPAAIQDVSFIDGPPAEALQALLQEAVHAGLDPQLVLIDGWRNASNAQRSLETLLEFEPRRALVVLMHGTAEPEWHQAVCSVDWQRSPFVQWVDTELVARASGAERQAHAAEASGLAMAFLTPTQRREPLSVRNARREARPRERSDSPHTSPAETAA